MHSTPSSAPSASENPADQRLIQGIATAVFCCLLSGCSDDALRPVSAAAPLHGCVHGGQQPVTGALIDRTLPIASLSWANPAAIVYGTALSPTQLDAAATVAGSLSYSPAGGTVLPAGSSTLTANFTPTDTTDYPQIPASVPLTVSMATPAIAWASPAPISNGVPLGATQLNASLLVENKARSSERFK